MSSSPRPVAVVGGGWAGLAAAVELSAAGRKVIVLEAAKQLGGRARSVDWDGLRLDNGQHLMVGAYREMLRLMGQLGTLDTLERRPLDLRMPDFHLRLPRLPAPLHLAAGLLAARGLGLTDKLRAARFMRALQARAFKLERDEPAAPWLVRHGQSPALVDKLWGPICVAALNTPLEQSSAQVFCHVLRDSLAGTREDSDLLFNRTDMSRLLPEAAASFILQQGGQIGLSSKVDRIDPVDGGYRLTGTGVDAEQVILAVHPVRLPALVGHLPALATTAGAVARYDWEPILTLWLRFATPPPLPFPMLGLGGAHAPWVFEREDLGRGVASIVFSAEGEHLRQPPETLRDDCLARMAQALGPLPPLLAWKIITEKRATFRCVPDLPRPDNVTALPGLYLAGDYTAGDYPATLEGALRSGVQCARLIIREETGAAR